MGERPMGTVSFLFTDIVGSTRRWEEDAETMSTELEAHDSVLVSAVEAKGGWMVKHTGDGICAAFASASAAVDAAVDAQRRLKLPVRMGINTGEAEVRGLDYFGPALNRAARVMSAAHGGQILVTSSTAGLLDDKRLIDLGEHRLRDLSATQRLYQVRASGLAEQFPPVRTLDMQPGNLPAQLTAFIGRDEDLRELVDLVRNQRLVTLTGVGGVGKTRLALAVAADVALEFGDGAWLVELAPVGDPAAVAEVVAAAMGASGSSGQATDRVVQALDGRRLVLVVDNCEHVLDEVAAVVEAVLTRTAGVHVIATSREGLRVPGEQLWSVPSLPTDGGASPAVQLFAERARLVRPGFSMAVPTEASAVQEICRHLDGIALAIELAAARLVSMSAVEVRDRLGDRFRLLTGARRGLQRHQTLRHAVAWSFDLLDDRERALLVRCSVFAGGFDPEAAAEVASDVLDTFETLDLLESLVRKSLVTIERHGSATRFGLLETIREFAEGQLADCGDPTEVRDRHARYFAREVVRRWPAPNEQRLWARANLDNLRAAFGWAQARADLATAADIAAHTARLTLFQQLYEPVTWAEALLDEARQADVPQLVRLYEAAGFTLWRGGPEKAIAYVERALDLVAEHRYLRVEPTALRGSIATALLFLGRHEESLEVYAELAEGSGFSRVAGLCGLLYGLPPAGRLEEARAIADDTVAAARLLGDPFHLSWALTGWARAHADTDPTRAIDVFREAYEIARAHELTISEPVIARDMAQLETTVGDLSGAFRLLVASATSFHRAGDHRNLVVTLADLAAAFHAAGRDEEAATLLGVVRDHPFAAGMVDLARLDQSLLTDLGEAVFAGAVERGRAMQLGEAVAFVAGTVPLG